MRELLAFAPDSVIEVYVDSSAAERTAEFRLAQLSVPLHECSPEVFAALVDTAHPQGILAVARPIDVPLSEVFAADGGFVVVLSNVRDPGNAGTVIRGADAAGAAAVIVSDASVDIYNPKVVRSTVGSLWHLPISVGHPVETIIDACRAAGLRVLAADGAGDVLLPDADLGGRHAWLMGNEAWGLPHETRALCDEVIRVPIYGHAESLNLAMAATVCLYASAAAQR